ncbi:hypothetical protein [Pseudactinotalea sp.]|uniref:hypothetical protein n=1 Tax=Pseudactinotalea sp. TaxID=1926260 RepID=UPI003B3BE63B
MTTTTNTVAERLRVWARGIYPVEAGVELLIRHDKAIYDDAPWVHDDGERAWLDVDVLLDGSGAWSGGEQRIVRLAASLIGQERVNLSDDVTGNDRRTTALVLASIAHANGSHQDGDVVFDDAGRPSTVRLGSLYPWPSE